jgi:hypothetical protein
LNPKEDLLAGNESDPDSVFLELTEQISQRLQSGESVDTREYFTSHPQWAGAIRRLLPTIYGLVECARAVDRATTHKQHEVNPDGANDHEP